MIAGTISKKGVPKTVDPIRNERDIQTICRLLKDKPRYCALFLIGTNTNLRISDLLRLKAGEVRDLKKGDCLTVIERKTRKRRDVVFNGVAVEAAQKLLEYEPLEDDELLFHTRYSKRKPLTREHAGRLVKESVSYTHLTLPTKRIV